MSMSNTSQLREETTAHTASASSRADGDEDVNTVVTAARSAQTAWASVPLKARVAILRRLRAALVEHVDTMADSVTACDGRQAAEALTGEVLPLIEGVRFLERRSIALLSPKRVRRGRPQWLVRSDLTIHREPLGVVLVIGPANYPLFLPATHALQALAAGNAVLIKPAPRCEGPMVLLARLAIEAGIPKGVLAVVDSEVRSATIAIPQVNHVVFTGSASGGHSVHALAARHTIPVTLELSGHDAAFVLEGADVSLFAKAMRFGLTFNRSSTCIAPRRAFVLRSMLDPVRTAIEEVMRNAPTLDIAPGPMQRMRSLALNAIEHGARVLVGTVPTDRATVTTPLVLENVLSAARVLREEAFAPLLVIVPVDSMDEALSLATLCPMALGATVFGPPAAAEAFALRANAGCVVINDTIVPTADPRLPFQARGASGFGVTRGADGLLAMTTVKAIAHRHGRFRPHFDPISPADAGMASAYIRMAHGPVSRRAASAVQLVKLLMARFKRSAS